MDLSDNIIIESRENGTKTVCLTVQTSLEQRKGMKSEKSEWQNDAISVRASCTDSHIRTHRVLCFCRGARLSPVSLSGSTDVNVTKTKSA